MKNDSNHRFRLGLLLAGGTALIRRLVANVPSSSDLYVALLREGANRKIVNFASELSQGESLKVLDRVKDAGWRWIVPGEADYPAALNTTSDPPLGLFVRGHLVDLPRVAVVGSRKASPYGLQVARLLGEELGRAGVVVLSGMARGVDESVHRGALSVGGASWAVWGTGPDRIYPPEHGELANSLADTGALLTEYPPGTPPRRHHFPERNRILAGLAQAVVVVEAAARSGALVTARLALDEGRDVLAVPGNIFSATSIGPNALLRLGARPLLTPRDVFDAIGMEHSPQTKTDAEDGLLPHIGTGEALTVDEIAARAEKSIVEIQPILLELELDGDLRREADGRYLRVLPQPNS